MVRVPLPSEVKEMKTALLANNSFSGKELDSVIEGSEIAIFEDYYLDDADEKGKLGIIIYNPPYYTETFWWGGDGEVQIVEE